FCISSIRWRVFKNVLCILGYQLIQSRIGPGEKVGSASRQRLGDSLKIRSAGDAKLSSERIFLTAGWTKHRLFSYRLPPPDHQRCEIHATDDARIVKAQIQQREGPGLEP